MSSVPPPASAMRKPCLEGFYKPKINLNIKERGTEQLTESTSEANPLNTHACKLASPSVTNQILALPLSVSGTKLAYTAAALMRVC